MSTINATPTAQSEGDKRSKEINHHTNYVEKKQIRQYHNANPRRKGREGNP
jgi:hypothetical protein